MNGLCDDCIDGEVQNMKVVSYNIYHFTQYHDLIGEQSEGTIKVD